MIRTTLLWKTLNIKYNQFAEAEFMMRVPKYTMIFGIVYVSGHKDGPIWIAAQRQLLFLDKTQGAMEAPCSEEATPLFWLPEKHSIGAKD